jgi:hypothetical protein
VRSVACDWKDCGQNPVEENRQIIFGHLVRNHFFDDVRDNRVQKFTCHYFDLISSVNSQPTGAIE